MAKARKQINPSQRGPNVGGEASSPDSKLHVRGSAVGGGSKSRCSPLSIGLIVVAAFVVIVCIFLGSGGFGTKGAANRVEGDFSCTFEVERIIPFLKKAYGDSMHKVLHVGPDTCLVVSTLLREKETEAWGVEPYDVEDADHYCKSLVRKGLVRVADIKFPFPYRAKSFSLVLVSDAAEYLSPKYLNKTLPELARISTDGLIIFTGYPHHHKIKDMDKSKVGHSAKLRSAVWWSQYFAQLSLEENEAAVKKFEQAAAKGSYSPSCQIFHLKSYQ